jgi:mannose-6-phosphate isomerase-like protein (cupin superfamily)
MSEKIPDSGPVIDGADDRVRGDRAHIIVSDALRRLENAAGARSVLLFEHGTLQVKFYAPRGPGWVMTDQQTPHSRDEIYVVARGRGLFFNGTSRRQVQPGDLIFAPAGSQHRFEDFNEDFAVWVMFYGPEGGEATT